MIDGGHYPPDIIEVSSRDNPTLKLARSLHRRRLRQRERATLVEGDRAVTAAIASGVSIRACLLRGSTAAATMELEGMQALPHHVRRYLVEDAHFAEVATTETPQGVILIVDIPESETPASPRFVLVADGVREPGNLGSMIRTAAAAGVDVVALLSGTVDAWHPEAVRGSAGTAFSVPVVAVPSLATVVGWFDTEAPHVVVLADAHGDNVFDVGAWPSQLALVMGSEAHGVRDDVRTDATHLVSIPMQRGVESLNVGAATAVLVYVMQSRQE